MNRWLHRAAVALALTGCGNTYVPSPPPADPGGGPGEPADMIMNDINLYLHDTRPTAGAVRKPTLWVHANSFTMPEDNIWALEDARAVIYGTDQGEEEIILEAKRGRFEQGTSAYLNDGVKAYVGDMTIELSDIEWRNPEENRPGEARSNNPVKVSDPNLQLEASSVRLDPDSKEFELTNVAGIIHFGRTKS